MIRIRYILPVVALPFVSACAGGGADAPSAGCAGTTDMVQAAACYQTAERAVWAKQSPLTLADFDAYSTRQLALARDLEAGRITREQYADRLLAAQDALAAAQARAYPSKEPANLPTNAPFPLSVYQTIVAAKAAQDRADADAAVAKAMQEKGNPYPTVGNTTCSRNPAVPSQVECRAINPPAGQ